MNLIRLMCRNSFSGAIQPPVASNRNRYEMIIVASRKNLYEIVLDIKRLLSSLATVFEY
jgi:hypothetical protein